MKVILPLPLNRAMLSYTSVPDTALSAWSSSTAYAPNSTVVYDDKVYTCVNVNINKQPNSNLHDGGTTTSTASKGELVTLRNLGSNYDGVAGLTAVGVPTDNSDYYTFDGSTDGLYGTNLGSASTYVVYAKLRIRDKAKGSAQLIWKDGGNSDGLAVGIDASGNLGIFGRSGGSLTSITVASTDYEDDKLYSIYATRTRFTVVDSSGNVVVTATGNVTSGNGTGVESIAYCNTSSPLTGTVTTGQYFDGDIYTVEVFSSGDLTAPGLTGSGYWEYAYDVNQMRMFDQKAKSYTTVSSGDPVVVQVTPGYAFDSVGLIGLLAETVNIEVYRPAGTEIVTDGEFTSSSNWTTGTGWSVASGVATCDGTQTADTYLQQNVTLTNGDAYLATYEVSRTAGQCNFNVLSSGQSEETLSSASGTRSIEFTHAGSTGTNTLQIRGDLDFEGAIDNFSVRPITTINSTFSSDVEWTKGDGWTISGGTASCDGTQTATSYLTNSQTLDTSKNHIIIIDIDSITQGSLYVPGGTEYTTSHTGSQAPVTLPAGTTSNLRLSASSNFIGDINSFVVYECHYSSEDTLEDLPTESGLQEWVFESVEQTLSLVKTDITAYSDNVLVVTIDNDGSGVSCGEMVVGQAYEIGRYSYGSQFTIDDYSTKTESDAGAISVTEGDYSKQVDYSVSIETDKINIVTQLLAGYRATPCVYVGNSSYQESVVYGFYESFDITASGPTRSDCNIKVEELV